MRKFDGFRDKPILLIDIPDQFFTDILPIIADLHQLKLALYLLFTFGKIESGFHYTTLFTILDKMEIDQILGFEEIDPSRDSLIEHLKTNLKNLSELGIIFLVDTGLPDKPDTLIFLNSSKGRAAIQAYQNGQLSVEGNIIGNSAWENSKPSLFTLYEDNIGPLTPIIADAIIDAENDYPERWISEAINLSAKRNIRNWNYINAILKKWRQNGRDESVEAEGEKPDYKKYSDGEFADLIDN